MHTNTLLASPEVNVRRGSAGSLPAGVLFAPAEDQSEQREDDLWFLGGHPRLPPGMAAPRCTRCGALLTLYLHLALVDAPILRDRSVQIFACTTCFELNDAIPDAWSGGPIVDGIIRLRPAYLRDYQTFFRMPLHPTRDSAMVTEEEPRLEFVRLDRRPEGDPFSPGLRVGGLPTFGSSEPVRGAWDPDVGRLTFVAQVPGGMRFTPRAGAPPQATLLNEELARLGDEPESAYELFSGGPLWLFAAEGEAAEIWALSGDPRDGDLIGLTDDSDGSVEGSLLSSASGQVPESGLISEAELAGIVGRSPSWRDVQPLGDLSSWVYGFDERGNQTIGIIVDRSSPLQRPPARDSEAVLVGLNQASWTSEGLLSVVLPNAILRVGVEVSPRSERKRIALDIASLVLTRLNE